MSNREMASIACKILSIYIIIQGINGLSRIAFFATRTTSDEIVYPFTELLFASAGMIAKFVIGLGIFLGSQGLVNFSNKMRTLGAKMEDNNSKLNDQ